MSHRWTRLLPGSLVHGAGGRTKAKQGCTESTGLWSYFWVYSQDQDQWVNYLSRGCLLKTASLLLGSTAVSQSLTWNPKLPQSHFCLWIPAKLLLSTGHTSRRLPLLPSCCHRPHRQFKLVIVFSLDQRKVLGADLVMFEHILFIKLDVFPQQLDVWVINVRNKCQVIIK